MINSTKSIINFLDNTKELPTILSGDLNIHDKSEAVNLFSKKLNFVNPGLKNTLTSKFHPVFKNDPKAEGYAVDYVFQKGFQVLNWNCPDVEISDHLPVVAELELI